MAVGEHIAYIRDFEFHQGVGMIYYHLPAGESFSHVLKNQNQIAVMDTEITAGSRTDFHYHDELELFVVYKGGLKITFEHGDTVEVNAGEVAKIIPKTLHKVEAKEDTLLISISIPRLKMYSNENELTEEDERDE